MKKLSLFLLLLFFIGFGVFAQTTKGPRQMNMMFSKNVKYPTEARLQDKTGFVTLSISIDEKGYPIGEPKVYSGVPELSEEVLMSYEIVKESWAPSYLDGKKVGEDYLMSFEFILSKGEE
ncbi:energy transducer TonB [Algoriphagus sp. SE2]|uniref:energy transducer TonB n=1 Tax=Algoriphagus sp. SE2 TaxID=3141536 RepID=UPI0031CD4954